MEKNNITKKETEKIMRPPIVVVVGHIDHGKTTILDWYRKTAVAGGEAGGITQRIGAYEIEREGRRFTFIDTPGHEAFVKIRSRGAAAADVGILVVAADEGVKAQTREAIAALQEAKIPFVAALNKADRPDANPERVKQELAKEGVLAEGYGGQVPALAVSAKTGAGMDELLGTLGLLADLEELSASPDAPAEGVVIETEMDPRRGIAATLLVQDGTLKKGDTVVIGRNTEVIKILENASGSRTDEAGPSSPARVTGLSHAPLLGDSFRAFSSRRTADEYVAALPPPAPSDNGGAKKDASDARPVFAVVLKADASGSLEAAADTLFGLSGEQVAVRIVKSEVGDINESDIKVASATRLVTVVGFRVGVDAASRELARAQRIRIVTGDVIYDLAERVKEAIRESVPAEVRRVELGRVKILKVFKKENGKEIVGGRVTDGVISSGARFDIVRMGRPAGSGIVAGLQRERAPTSEVAQGLECGIMADGRGGIREGDELALYREETRAVEF